MPEVTTIAALPPVPVFLSEGHATTTSRDVAEFFGKEHRNVLQSIERLECSEAFNRLNFQPVEYVDARNRQQKMYRMTRDGFTFLAMGFTGPRAAAFKEAFIAAFNAMEQQLRGGAELPYMQRQIDLLVQRQAETDTKVNAILDLVDVTKRYVALLESNQKPGRRMLPYKRVTPEIEVECKDLFAQGLSTTDVSLHLGIARATAHRIKAGLYIGARARAPLPHDGESA